MVVISALLFIVLNLLLGLSGVYLLRYFLFHPTKELYVGGIKIPFTPGLAIQQKEYWTRKLYDMLEAFLKECERYDYDSSISKLERKVYYYIWDSMETFENSRYLPGVFTRTMKKFAAQLSFEVFRHFIRSFIPFLMDKYNVESYIDLLSQKFDVQVIEEYYARYFHRYLVYLFGGFFLLMGFFNMVVFLIVR